MLVIERIVSEANRNNYALNLLALLNLSAKIFRYFALNGYCLQLKKHSQHW